MSDQKKPPKLIPVKEVCRRIGVSRVTIWKWVHEGKFPPGRRLGRRIFWLESDIDDWIAKLPTQEVKGKRPKDGREGLGRSTHLPR
jgi:prophage regulatory protein